MTETFPLYWIPLLPLIGAAFNLLLGRKLSRRLVHLVACSTVLSSFVVAAAATLFNLLPLWRSMAEGQGHAATSAAPALVSTGFTWISAGSLSIKTGLLLDPLSAVMVGIITLVGFFIHVYSMGYMHEEPDYARFFGYLNLFTGVMLLLVLGDNLVVLFLGWEGVGLCSYLLIGFWYDRDGTRQPGDANATAGRKAFIVNRIGDFAFLLGLFLLFSTVGTLDISELAKHTDQLMQLWTPLGIKVVSVAAISSLLFFLGATGKSAQIPLYVWLPDAMAGPTPVSALIHAATMVTAGVYMVARLNFLYMLSPVVMGIVALVGAFTALYAATIGLAQNDIKKILAYSTISQLGYMFLGVGVGAFSAGVFHLFTHAFFKACLFLGAGSVIHAMGGKQDIREMGGLAKQLPITRWTFLVSCLAISGIPFFSGFFSKDEILWRALTTTNPGWPTWFPSLLYGLGLAGAMCTAFYMFRLYYLTFSGTSRADAHTQEHIHESPRSMIWPLTVLANGAAFLGFLGLPALTGMHNYFHQWLAPVVEQGTALAKTVQAIHPVKEGLLSQNHEVEVGLMALSVALALGGILIARAFYRRGPSPRLEQVVRRVPRLYRILTHKYYIDEFYHWTVVKPVQWFASLLWRVVDSFFIDLLAVSGTAWVIDVAGRISRRLQNGNTQRYLMALMTGMTLMIVYIAWPPDQFVIRPDRHIQVGHVVVFDASPALAHDQRSLEYQWDFDGDGTWDTDWSTQPIATYTFKAKKTFKAVLRVRDRRWQTVARETKSVEVE